MIHTETSLSENLKQYFKNNFYTTAESEVFNDSDSFWNEFLADGLRGTNAIDFLKQCFPQFCFPIEKDIHLTQSYKDAVLKGKFDGIDFKENLLLFNDIDNLSFFIYESFAGEIPVLIVPDKNDFEKIIQVLIYKNNPVNLSPSMGASLISGINNWKRINILKERWELDKSKSTWIEEFQKNILPFHHLYKDQLIVLSKKSYSNIDAEKLKIDETEWLSASFKIRLEHECTHLYTIKRFGTAKNNLHDELIADYVGIIKSFGSYNKNLMMHFMGLENFPNYRKGARLENYIKEIEINSPDFLFLTTIIKNAIDNITLFDNIIGPANSNKEIKNRIESLCKVDLLDIASKRGSELILKEYFQNSI